MKPRFCHRSYLTGHIDNTSVYVAGLGRSRSYLTGHIDNTSVVVVEWNKYTIGRINVLHLKRSHLASAL